MRGRNAWERCSPLFNSQVPSLRVGRAWILTAVLHVVAAILAVTIPWQAPRRRTDYVVLQPLDARDSLQIAPFGGRRPNPAREGPQTSARRPPPPAAPAPATPTPPADTTPAPAALAYDPNAQLVPAPRVGDGRLWVSPRPALPGVVADVLYGAKETHDSVAVVRLRSMVDSLNEVVDSMQRIQRRPTWTVGGGEGGMPKFGIDSQFIHVAGIKIPTAALALIGNLLPQGNFDEGMRARQLEAMRQDLLQAAARAQTLQDFRRYVRELRERKQAEREAEKRRQQRPDTVKAVP